MNFLCLRQIFAVLLSMTLLTACESLQAQERSLPKEKFSYGDSYGQLNDQGQLRTYYLYTPKSYNPNRPMPLLLVFHGHGGSGHSIADVTRFNELAEQKGFIAVYPDGIDHEWSLRHPGPFAKENDVAFVNALIEHLKQTRTIDSHRIYATGFSKGGILTQALACELSDKIAAFASVAGSLPVRLKPNCQPHSPISMLMINGTNDLAVNYQGDKDTSQRGALVSVPETVNFWRSQDKCTSAPEVKELPGSNPRDRIQVKTARFSGCSGGSEVMLASVVSGGHFWPGGATQDPSTIQFNAKLKFNASNTIWDFFGRHTLP